MGWSGLLREGRWSPIVVSIENPGPAVEGRLLVELTAGSDLLGTRTVRAFSVDIELPARSRRRFPQVIPVAAGTRSALVQVSATGVAGEPVVLASRRLDLREAVTDERIIAVVASELSLDSLATALSTEGSPARVVYPHPEYLPDLWAGWDAVDLAVIRDTSFHRLRASQVEALRRWVAAGGTLVLAGGAAAPQLGSPELDALSPVEVTGFTERAGLDSLAGLGRTAAPRGRLLLASGRARAGAAVLAADGDLPIVATRRLGDGAVTFLAFDPADRPISGWSGGDALWRALAEPGSGRRADLQARDPFDDPWIAPLAASFGFSFPSWGGLAGFAGGYLALAVLLLVVPSLRPARPLPPVLVAVGLLTLSLISLVVAWALFDRSIFRGGAFALESAIVEAFPGDGLGLVERRVAVFSTAATEASFEVGSPGAIVEEVAPLGSLSAARLGERRTGTVETGAVTAVRDLPLGRYASRLFSIREVVPFDLGGSLERGAAGEADDGVEVTVRAPAEHALREAFVLLDGRATALGDVPAGSTLTRRLDVSGDVLIADPARRSFWERVGPALAAEGPIVAAWLDAPATVARSRGSAASVCLVVMRLQ